MGEEALEILRGILKYSSLPITISDIQGRLQLFSRAAEELTGYRSEEVLGRHASILFPKKWRVPMVFSMTLEQGAVEDVEASVQCKDGRVVPVSLYMTVVHDVLGRPSGFLAVTKDLSEQRQLEQVIEDARIKEEFYTDLISHDVRNYDQTLLGYMDLLLEEALGAIDDRAAELAALIRQDSVDLRDFIERIRVLSGREPGGDLPSVPVDLGAVVRKIADSFVDDGESSAKAVISEIESEEFKVRADPLVERLLRDLYDLMGTVGTHHGCGPCVLTLESDGAYVVAKGTLELASAGASSCTDFGDLVDALRNSSEVFVLRGLAEQFGGNLVIGLLDSGRGLHATLSLRVWDESAHGTQRGGHD